MNWYALTTVPQREFDSQYWLNRCGYDTFVPVENKRVRAAKRARRKISRAFPLVPGYLFLSVEQLPWLDLASSVSYVTGVLGNPITGDPQPVPPAQMETLFALDRAGAQMITESDGRRRIVVGDHVAIIHGPMRGRTARVRVILNRRARLLMQWFDSAREVEVRLEHLEAA